VAGHPWVWIFSHEAVGLVHGVWATDHGYIPSDARCQIAPLSEVDVARLGQALGFIKRGLGDGLSLCNKADQFLPLLLISKLSRVPSVLDASKEIQRRQGQSRDGYEILPFSGHLVILTVIRG
jgi:hypothetical protein